MTVIADQRDARRQLELLVSVQRAVSQTLALELPPDDLLAAVAKGLASALGGRSSAVWRPHPGTGVLTATSVGPPWPAGGDRLRAATADAACASGRTQFRRLDGDSASGVWIAVGQGGPVLEALTPATIEEDDAVADFLDAIGEQVRLVAAHRRLLAESAIRLGGQSEVAGTAEDAPAPDAVRRDFDFLQVLLDSMDQGVAVCDREGNLTLFNRAMAEQLGRPLVAVGPDAWAEHFGLRDAVTGDVLPIEAMPLYRALRGEEVRAEKLQVVTPAGDRRVVTINARPLKGQRGEIIGGVAVMRDETDERRALRRMEEAERLAAIGIWELDLERDEAFNSAGIGRILGVDPADVDINSWQAAMHPEDVQATAARLERALATCEPTWEDEYRIIRADGNTRLIHVFTEATYGPDGAPRRLRGTVQDYTDRADAEARGSQHDRMDSLGQLAGGIAHDFNNLLAVILSYTEFALEDLGPGSAVCSDLFEIRKAAQRAADLTRRLLVFSRREVVRPQLVDVGTMLQGLRPVLSRTLGEHLRIHVDVALGLGPVSADPSRLEQMLLNLALNARDAMPEGGVLSFAVDGLVIGAGETPDLEPGSYVRIRVSDTGVGMSPEVATHIFEPFFTTKLKGQGTGLGLSTAYGVVNEMKGRISARSALGRGTTIEVLMPVAGDETVTWAGPARDLPAPVVGLKRILVVEDDDAVRTAATRILERGGYEVMEAGRAETALSCLAECAGRIDLLVTDVVMPGMSGWNLHLEVSRRWPDIPTVFVSGYAAELIEREALAEGSVDFIAKPFSAAELLDVVAAQLG